MTKIIISSLDFVREFTDLHDISLLEELIDDFEHEFFWEKAAKLLRDPSVNFVESGYWLQFGKFLNYEVLYRNF